MKINVFDIGGTFVKYGVWESNALHAVSEFPTNGPEGAERLMNRVRKAAAALGPADALGICMRGQVNCTSGEIIYDPPHVIAGYTGTNLKEAFSCFGVPVAVENDVNCMAFAEAQACPVPENGDLICLTYGTCIGGAIVRGGQVYHGANWSAGEFGMMYTGGQYYENVASVSALVTRMRKVDCALSNGRKIAAAMERPDVAPHIAAWADAVAEGLASLIHIFDPAAVVIGGGFIEDARILALIRSHMQQRIAPGFHAPLLPARHGNKAGLIGAALLAQQRFKAAPEA